MITRSKRTQSFSVINNDVFARGLSAEATGVLVYLLSKPDDWNVQCEHLASHFACGIDRVRRIVLELMDAGFATRHKRQDGTMEYTIFDEAMKETPVPQPESQNAVLPDRQNARQAKHGPILNTESKRLNTERSTKEKTTLRVDFFGKPIERDGISEYDIVSESTGEILVQQEDVRRLEKEHQALRNVRGRIKAAVREWLPAVPVEERMRALTAHLLNKEDEALQRMARAAGQIRSNDKLRQQRRDHEKRWEGWR